MLAGIWSSLDSGYVVWSHVIVGSNPAILMSNGIMVVLQTHDLGETVQFCLRQSPALGV